MKSKFDLNYVLAELETNDNFMLSNLLKDLGSISILDVKDKEGLTLLHHAVLKGIDGKTQLLIDFARNYQKHSNEDVLNWINMQTFSEKWTALHYASFSGNLDAVYTLIENGADIKALNSNGLNMLHVAAQGDQAPPLYLFKMMGLSINSVDNRGSTPLHWACYS